MQFVHVFYCTNPPSGCKISINFFFFRIRVRIRICHPNVCRQNGLSPKRLSGDCGDPSPSPGSVLEPEFGAQHATREKRSLYRVVWALLCTHNLHKSTPEERQHVHTIGDRIFSSSQHDACPMHTTSAVSAIAQRSAEHPSVCLSFCLSVRYTSVLHRNGWTHQAIKATCHREPHGCSFLTQNRSPKVECGFPQQRR